MDRTRGGGVLVAIGGFGLGDQFGGALIKPLLAVVGVDRGVRGDLGPVDRDRAEAAQPAPAAIINT